MIMIVDAVICFRIVVLMQIYFQVGCRHDGCLQGVVGHVFVVFFCFFRVFR